MTPETGGLEEAVDERRLRRARAGDAITFFLVGFVYASFAARVPAVKSTLGITDGQLAIAFLGLNAGAILGLQAGGAISPRAGSSNTLRIALPVFGLSLLGPALAGDLVALTAALFAMAFMNSVVDVGMNAQGVAVQRGYGRPIMSGLHALLPVGLIAGSGVAALAAHLDLSLPVHLGSAGALAALVGLAAGTALLPARVDVERPGTSSARSPLSLRGWSQPMLVIGGLAFVCTLADGAALEWTTVLLRDDLGASPGTAALGFTVFAAAMAVGRLSGDALTVRFGPVRLFRTGVLVAGGGWVCALLLHTLAAGFVGVALLGAGLSYALPLAISAGGNLPGTSPAVATARVSTLAYLGSFTGPAAIGWLAADHGLSRALLLPAALVALTAVRAGSLAPAGRSIEDRAA